MSRDIEKRLKKHVPINAKRPKKHVPINAYWHVFLWPNVTCECCHHGAVILQIPASGRVPGGPALPG